MGEPNSVMAEILQLCLLAGSKIEKRGSDSVKLPVLDPADVTPATWTDSVLWPGAGTTTIFDNHPIPAGQIFIATYCSLVTSLQDQSSLDINFGMVGSAAISVYSDLNGTYNPFYTSLPWQSIFNTPIFVIFPGGQKPRFLLGSAGGVVTLGSVTVDVNMSGYLVDSSLFPVFKKYQKVIYFD